MQNVPPWRELYRCRDASRARMIATCVEAMEFEARLRAPLSDAASAAAEPVDEWPDDLPGPFVVEVPASDWPGIHAVLDEIIDEQDEFDDLLRLLEERTARTERKVLLVMIVIVSTLGAVGAIEL